MHVGRNQARVDELVRPLDIGIAKPRFLVSGRVGQFVDIRDEDKSNRSLGAALVLASTDRQASQVTRDGRHQPVVEWATWRAPPATWLFVAERASTGDEAAKTIAYKARRQPQRGDAADADRLGEAVLGRCKHRTHHTRRCHE